MKFMLLSFCFYRPYHRLYLHLRQRCTAERRGFWRIIYFGLGAGLNLNFPHGTYVLDNYSYTSGSEQRDIFVLMEISTCRKLDALFPRIHYSNISGAFYRGVNKPVHITNGADFATRAKCGVRCFRKITF